MSTQAHPLYDDTDSIAQWNMRLFVTDWTPRCVVAYKNLTRICAEHLKDTFINVVDPKSVAALIVEPVLGEGGFVVPPSYITLSISKIPRRTFGMIGT